MNKWKVGFIVISVLSILFIGWMQFNSYRYNKTIEWIYSIPAGMDIDSVKKITPNYIDINWENPEKIGSESIYYINIKWNYDFLKMSNGLIFEDNRYKERFVHK